MREQHITTETLIDYLHGELSPDDDALVLAHLGACQACTAAYNAQTALTERLRAFARSEERELPPRVLFAVRERIARRERQAWWLQLGAALRPAVALPAAVVLVLAAVLGLSSIRSGIAHAPSIAAAYYLDDHAALADRLMPLSQPPAIPAALASPQTSQGTSVATSSQDALTNLIASE
jgi:predicted anti-sigma-YlaC factor YlaD